MKVVLFALVSLPGFLSVDHVAVPTRGEMSLAQFSGVDFVPQGTDAPSVGTNWDVMKDSKLIASSETPAGWEADYDPSTGRLFLGVPLAPIGSGYEVRLSAGGKAFSMGFDVAHFKDSPLGVPVPLWARGVTPGDTVEGNGPSGAVDVNLATGVVTHAPQRPDIEVNNPTGPDAKFSRSYQTDLALKGESAPGFPVGWTHNYATLITGQPGPSGDVVLREYNGAVERFAQIVEDGTPTGKFKGPPGDPFVMTGDPNPDAPGTWKTLTITQKNLSKLCFIADSTDANTYRLRQIVNAAGHYIQLHYDTNNGYRIKSIENDEGVQLVQFDYDNGGLINRATTRASTQLLYDCRNRELMAVSQLTDVGDSKLQTGWSYSYASIDEQPFLETVGIPSPTGTGIATCTLAYDPAFAKCIRLTDAEGNRHEYKYQGGWRIKSGG